jgi:UDP-2,4-diacetamido-2,4,6-trideoxy-beta-L-altropyranose hydrolase
LNVLFRTDVSSAVGLGHLVRCRALAAELTARGARCHLVGPTADQLDEHHPFASVIPRPAWSSEVEDAHRLLELVTSLHIDRLVLDDYRVRVAYQRALVAGGAPDWLQMAPRVGEEIHARWVFNANPSASVEAYGATTVRTDVRFLVGPSFALLRQEFRQPLPARVEHPEHPTVLISLGGGDDRGATTFVLNALRPLIDRVRPVVIAGRENPNNPAIAQAVAGLGPGVAALHIAPANVAALLATAHLGVLAAGTTTFEAAVCGLASVLIPISENQKGQAEAWDRLGVATALSRVESLEAASVQSAVAALLEDEEERRRRGAIGRELVDGLGVVRVAAALLEDKTEQSVSTA